MTSTPPEGSDEALPDEAPHDEPMHGEADAGGDPGAPTSEPVRTGVERVDEVIRAVEELEERPLEEHVGVFESAHGRLRRALDDPGDSDPQFEPGDPGDGDRPGHA